MNKSDSAVTVPPWIKPRSAYLHIPFCAHHCGYCDFAIATGKDEMIDRYLDALSIELSWLDTPQSVRTIFLGGGTPTYLSCEQLNRLLNTIRHWLPLIDEKEFSIEANPDTLSVEKIELLLDHGVNRFSLGSQSFRREVLQVLDRRHNPEQIATCVEDEHRSRWI